jgi:acetyltransferase-like isoleucine patch superfamily enzyme
MYYKNKPITLKRLLRKTSSYLSLLNEKCRTYKYRILFFLTGVDITFGKNVSFGRMVRITTPDGGKIRLGNNVRIGDFTILFAERCELKIGNNSGVGIGTHIVALNSITIGEWCLIGPYCTIRDMNHGMDTSLPMALQKQETGPIVIGNDVWLGTHVVVTAGSTIGDGAVIGANAVVTSDIPKNVIAAGVPAHVIRERSKN